MSYGLSQEGIIFEQNGRRRRSPQGPRATRRALVKNAFPATKWRLVTNDRHSGKILQLRVLGLSRGRRLSIGATQVHCGRSTRRKRFWKIGFGAKRVKPEIGLEEVRDIGGSFLVGPSQKFKCLVLIAESSVYRRNHVGRHIVRFGLSQQIAEYLLCIRSSARGCVGVRQVPRWGLCRPRIAPPPSGTQGWPPTACLTPHKPHEAGLREEQMVLRGAPTKGQRSNKTVPNA